jgi:hypothetical protein
MTYIPFNDKANSYDMMLFSDSNEGMKLAKERLEKLNARGPKGWRLLPVED